MTLRAQGAEEFELPLAKFFRSVRLAYALTQASVQGLTFEGLISICNATHPHFDRRKLYVCVSRARRSDQLIVQGGRCDLHAISKWAAPFPRWAKSLTVSPPLLPYFTSWRSVRG